MVVRFIFYLISANLIFRWISRNISERLLYSEITRVVCILENRVPVKWKLGNVCKLGPVVQSVVSLTSSLRVNSLTVLADSIHNILIFFAEKM